MSYSLAAEYREEFSKKYGSNYEPSDYVAPQAILDADLRRLVAKLKISDAQVRQMDIHHEMQKYKKGDVAILPDDKKHLVEDFEEAKKVMEAWEPYRH